MGARFRLTMCALTVATLTWAPAPPSALAAGPEDVEFVGSGWGHGVGMSQYGAYAMAVMGNDYEDILGHYYLGTSIAEVSAATSLWVNLERNFSTKTLSVLSTGGGGGTSVAINSDSGGIVAEVGATIGLSSMGPTGCHVMVTNPGQSPLEIMDVENCSVDFSWYAWATPGQNPTTKIQIEGCELPDWNSPGGTVWRPCQYARGQLHLRQGPGGLDLSAEMLLDDYVLGISEMPFSWSGEALKAQAVAARSYAEARRIVRGDPASNSCDGWCHVKDTTSDQRYVGWGHSNVGNWVSASNATSSEILTHDDSGIGVITAYYSSSSGGATEFGHLKGFASSPVEWLSSVNDTWAIDGTVFNPNASWAVGVSPSSIASAAGLDHLTSMNVSAIRAGSGSVAEVEIEGVLGGQATTVTKTGTWVRTTFNLKSEYFTVDYTAPPDLVFDPIGDEILLYKPNGTFRYNSLHDDGSLGAPILSGSNYTKNWKSISAIDLDGDGQDEVMFYREDGLYRYYQIGSDGYVGTPLQAGSEYTPGWDSITAVDLDGDGQDEIFFYREDGLYRYYNIASNGRIGSPIRAGSEYTTGWDSISAIDLDGDGQDEMFFYREDGLYRYYNVRPDGSLPSPMLSGSNYPTGWTTITAVDLDGDGQDEMLFYKDDGVYQFYDVKPNGVLGNPLDSGSDFGAGWSVITPINLNWN